MSRNLPPTVVALQTLTKNEEIDDHLRGMIMQEYNQHSWSHLRRIFNNVYVHVLTEIDRWKFEVRGEHNEDEEMRRVYEVTDKWERRMTRFQMRKIYEADHEWQMRTIKRRMHLVDRDEDYDIKDGVAILTWSGQYTYINGGLIEECLYTEDERDNKGEAHIITFMIRSIYREGEDTLESTVEIRDYEDRYEEEITKEHLEDNKHPEVIRRTIWKRDLFREEFHTIPYRPIHGELLYSLDLPIWFENEAHRAKEHFKSLI